jgi:nucleoside-diphosphate-sugar epimerase
MKVLVIGATGQTGRHAVKQLLARGHEGHGVRAQSVSDYRAASACVWSRARRAIRHRSIAPCTVRTPCSPRSARDRRRRTTSTRC